MSERRADPDWWALHLRKARGETLTDEERAAYEKGLRELQRGGMFPGDIETLRQLRAEMTRLKAECAELKALEAELDRQIAELEAKLSPDIRALLGTEVPTAVHPSDPPGGDEVTQLSEDAVREADQWERQE